MQESNEKNATGTQNDANSTGGGTIFMLLLVGFLVGTITGYMIKDPINRHLTKTFTDVMKQQQADIENPIETEYDQIENIAKEAEDAVKATVDEAKEAIDKVEKKIEGEKKEEEEKKPEEKKEG